MRGNEFLNKMSQVSEGLIEDSFARKRRRRGNVFWAAFGAVAASIALYFAMGLELGTDRAVVDKEVAYAVSFEVNPSILLELNAGKRVVAVEALNEDAAIALGDMELEDTQVNVAVNAIIGAMIKNGYVSELANSILVSVEDRNHSEGAETLEAEIVNEINAVITASGFEGAVLSQYVEQDDEAAALAENYGITEGKAELIQKIIALEPTYAFEDLTPLKINDLKLLMESHNLSTDEVKSSGTASAKGYIGEEAALSAALAYAGLEETQLWNLEIELDSERGVMVYEVEFNVGAYEYDYEINALDGSIVKSDYQSDDDWGDDGDGHKQAGYGGMSGNASADNGGTGGNAVTDDGEATQDNNQAASNQITAKEAKGIALNHAGVDEADIRDYECEYENEGYPCYEISFETKEYDYEYEICAETGKILEFEKEKD